MIREVAALTPAPYIHIGGDEAHTLPVVLDLTRRDPLDRQFENRGGRPIRMDLADGTELTGYLYVYRLRMDQVEELAEVSFDLTEEQIAKLKALLGEGGDVRLEIHWSLQKRGPR